VKFIVTAGISLRLAEYLPTVGMEDAMLTRNSFLADAEIVMAVVSDQFVWPQRTTDTPFETGTVVDCYDVLDLCRAGGVQDFTDGKYDNQRNNRRGYLAAQRRQAEYLLDQAGCYRGEQLLDIGCGYGRILQQAQERGVNAVGITLSPAQAAECQRRGLNAIVLNYRDIPRVHDRVLGRVHGIIANGSLEHFVQLSDALARREDFIYSEMFRIGRSLLARGERFVTTAIHFREEEQANPRDIVRGHQMWQRGSFTYHYANLVEAFGGWYPGPGQLERCAQGRFALVAEEDGTHDYYLTSEYWLRRLKWSLAMNPKVWWSLVKKRQESPRALGDMLRCMLVDQSWNWQFRGDDPPMRLFRQTWQAV
jgi:cyclopropane fatty-acyl-phospholipid synthase-like methyltransferase